MDRAGFSWIGGLGHPRRLVLGLSLAGLLTLGCAQLPRNSGEESPAPVARGANPLQPPPLLPPANLQTPQTVWQPKAQVAFQEPAPAKQIPVNLDSVLRLASDQNLRVQMAREKVEEALGGRALAEKAWLPDLWIGTSYYRHEGAIQNPNGTVFSPSFGALFAGGELNAKLDLRDVVFQKVNAERALWQQKGELAKITNEQLLDASTTYVDMLAAKAGEAIALTQETSLKELLRDTEALAKVDAGLDFQVKHVQAELASQRQITRKLRENFKSASAKLAYLLGLDPMADLVVMERQFTAFNLVDPQTTINDLVTQALAVGPGVREMEGLLNLIQEANNQNQGMAQYLPVFEAKVAEGWFGGGPGISSEWNNRLDVLLQVKWNLTDSFTRCERQRIAQSKITNLHTNYQDLRSRLTLGVQEAHNAIQSGKEQLSLVEDQIRNTKDALERSKLRLKKLIKGSSPSEVLLAIRSVGGAQLTYLSAIRDFDKAQLRLLLLLGPNYSSQPPQ